MLDKTLYQYVEQLIPKPSDDMNVAEMIRARFFVLTVILFICSSLSIFSLLLLVSAVDVSMLVIVLLVASIATQLISLVSYHRGVSLKKVAQFFIWAHYLIAFLICIFSGGLNSPFIIAFMLMPVFCGFVLDGRHCKIMLIISLFIVSLFAVLFLLGVHSPIFIVTDSDISRSVIFVIAVLVIILIFSAYELAIKALKTALAAEKNRFLHLAEHDELTGLLSYSAFEKILLATLDQQLDFALFYVDINDFKQLNQRYGHRAGDRALQQIAARIGSVIRNDDIVARVESDEFVIMINDVKNSDDIANIAQSIRQSVNTRVQLTEKDSEVMDCRLGYFDTLGGSRNRSTLVSLAKASMK